MLLYGNLPKTQHWPQICIFISFYWSLKARTQVTFVWILPIKLVGEKNSTISGQWRGSVLSFIYSINIYWGLPSPCSWSWSWCCLANQGVQNLPRGPDVFSVDTWSKVEMMSWKKKKNSIYSWQTNRDTLDRVGSMVFWTECVQKQNLFRWCWVEILKGKGSDVNY